MPKIIIDGQTVECRNGINVLQAALEAGLRIPHYCYHPGLSIAASCRMCMMEMKMPHPRTHEMDWAPKLFPSCQTPVKDGMEVRFESDAVKSNQKRVMEYYLLNHPLDCPVCDKAGECYLQDYSEEFGQANSRMVEEKHKNPKKDIGSKTLLYSDRCIQCGRCVRFTDEISGTGELRVTNRGSKAEIDVFPGVPLENPLQGNVVDLCPVGALLDKSFLFEQRVWLLKKTQSISPADSSGATIWLDHNNGRLFRIRPRFNEKVNEWWISDEQRHGWDYIYSPDRLNQPMRRENGTLVPTAWEDLPGLICDELARVDKVAAVLSPMMSCEEAYLLATFVRDVSPEATLVLGPVPTEGEDQVFAKGFTIKAEKCPNRRGIETLLSHFGGNTATFDEFAIQASKGAYEAAIVAGGYPKSWATDAHRDALSKIPFLIVHDLFPSALDEVVSLRVPSAAWIEREGSFMNCDGLLQSFNRAVRPLDGVKFDGQFYFELVGDDSGLYRAKKVREQMAKEIPAFAELFEPRVEPEYAH